MATKSKTKKEEDFKYLVIVESPAKSKTLTKILGAGYLVKSSVGHIRDLPSKGLGIKVKENFEPSYEVLSGKQKVVDELNQFAKKAEKVYLASDPDREGEAIAWHLSHVLGCPKKKVTRVSFNQITPDAVRQAINSPRDIDLDLVNAQQARRILDRLVGYKISPILWRKIGGRSAGRVQSIAVRLICEREEEVRKFVPQEYWSIKALVDDTKDSKKQKFEVNLVQVDGKRIIAPKENQDLNKNRVIASEAEVKEIVEKIGSLDFAVSSLNTKPGTRNPKPPFKTSTMQRAASNALGFTVKKTMQVAQTLYEGVKLGRAGDQTGLITYMRTDSLRLAPEALEEVKDYINKKWGAEYYAGEPVNYDKSKKSKKNPDKAENTQDAHEAIRPTYVDKDPESIKQFLTADQYKLYKLIWERFVTCQMAAMKLETKTVEINDANKEIVFRASASKKVFAGYTIVYGAETEASEDEETDEDKKVPEALPESLEKDNPINVHETDPAQHFTEPPPRYNEASLVRTLEELGIGRPSTYAPTIATVLDRKYVEKLDSKALAPTKLGINVNGLLTNHFGSIINVEFTSKMEDDLDKVSESKIEWHHMLSEFYFGPDGPPKAKSRKRNKTPEEIAEEEAYFKNRKPGFVDIVKGASEEIENVVIETEYKCPTCDAPMHLKGSRFGPFLGCSQYPDCKTIVNLTKEGTPAPPDRPYTEEKCPDCKNDSLVIRYGRYGDYIACTTEDCGYTSPIVKKLGIKCPREGCPGEIVEKKSRFGKMFYGCSSWSKTKCEVVFWYPPINPEAEVCPDCGKPLMYKTLKRGDKVVCSDTKECGYQRLASPKDVEKYRPKFEEKDGDDPANKSVFSIG